MPVLSEEFVGISIKCCYYGISPLTNVKRPAAFCCIAGGRAALDRSARRTLGFGMECLLFLFRHGETDWNRKGRLQGHTDTPLNATGLVQAEALTERLRPHRLDAVVSSDLARAWTTGRIVAE